MKNKTKRLAIQGLVCALVALLSVWQIPLPFPVPMTLQTFAVAFAGYLLGSLRGGISVLCYIALGAVGLPFFSGFRGGLSVLLEPGGGFIFGFLPLCLLCGLWRKNGFLGVALGIVGVVSCHLWGILHYMAVGEVPFVASFLAVSAPYLIKDFVMCIGAMYCARLILRKTKQ